MFPLQYLCVAEWINGYGFMSRTYIPLNRYIIANKYHFIKVIN